MPIADHPDRPAGRVLVDADGAELGRFDQGDRDGVPLADLFAPAAAIPPAHVAAAVLRELRGWRIATTPDFAQHLIDGGALPRRHAHVMSRDLVRDPAPAAWLDAPAPPGYRLTPADRPAIDLAPAARAAYPPDHPDFGDIPDPDRPELELAAIMSGELMGGPLLRCSGLAVREDGGVAGAILINATPGAPPFGGPWITNVFRHPDARGTGTPLIRRALAIATRDGLPALSLAVTHVNPARGAYARLGFADVYEALSVQL